MRIGLFVACAGRRDGGPETYEHGLVRTLARTGREHEYTVFCLSQAAADSFDLQQDNVRFHVLHPSLRVVSMPVSLPMAVRRDGVDLLHATMYPPLVSPVDYVFTMHDVSPLAFPRFYPTSMRKGLRLLVTRGLRQARLVVCATEHARATTVDQFRIDPARVSVVPHGIDRRFRPLPAAEAQAIVRERYRIRAPYVLYVGKLMIRKNLVRMLEAFAQLRREAPELTLVLCGRRFWDTRFLDKAIARLRLTDHIVETGYVPTDDLPILYSGCEMALYATLFEGFGFPLVEAMACGAPAVTSTVSCLPEIAGDAALLVNPESVEELTAAMRRLHFDAALRCQLRAKGLARAAQFTWERAAEGILAVYQRAAS